MDYLALVNDNQREDSYVNATKWCGAFGKRLNHFLSNKLTQDYIKAVENKTGIPASTLVATSKRKPTYVHPMVALALAAVRLTELLAIEHMEVDNAIGNKQTERSTRKAGKRVARVFE